MSNTDGEDTRRTHSEEEKFAFRDGWLARHKKVIELEQELASLREQLAKQEEVIRELIPIAQWGYDLLVPFDKERMGKEWPATIKKAKSLTTKDK